MADLPAGTYDVISLQGAYAREKTVRRHKLEQGIFKMASNRGASGHAQTPSLILVIVKRRKRLVKFGQFSSFIAETLKPGFSKIS